MYRYIFKFTKTDQMKYISHLDLMGLFQKTFRRAGIKITYSQGFSPHPKISIAHPLSLGISSLAEYMEVELVSEKNEKDLIFELNEILPKGIHILECKQVPKEGQKSLAALVAYGNYEIVMTSNSSISKDQLQKSVDAFLSADELIVTKRQVKTKSEKLIDIKPLIKVFLLKEVVNNQIKIETIIKTGSNGNLNPELLLGAFIKFTDLNINEEETKIIRKELYFSNEDQLIPLNNTQMFK